MYLFLLVTSGHGAQRRGPVRRIEIEDVESLLHISIEDAQGYPVIIGTTPQKITLKNVQRIQMMTLAAKGYKSIN